MIVVVWVVVVNVPQYALPPINMMLPGLVCTMIRKERSIGIKSAGMRVAVVSLDNVRQG